MTEQIRCSGCGQIRKWNGFDCLTTCSCMIGEPEINADSESCQVDTFVKPPPKIICICGSTRFADLHAIARWEFEKDGSAICLMINYLPAGYFEGFGNDHYGEKFGNKEVLDELHFRKIEMANEIYVINKNGYIGESTRNEIEYGKKLGKPIKYLEAV